MRIAIVEDDPQQLEHIESKLKKVFEVVQIASFNNAHDFLESLPAFVTSPPDLFLLDVMLPWRAPESLAPPPVEGWDVHRGGIRLLTRVREHGNLAEIPAIIWTALHPEQLVHSLPSSAVFLSKEAPPEHLITVIRSVLICTGNTPVMRKGLRAKLINATEIKASIFWISFDVKKFWASFGGQNH